MAIELLVTAWTDLATQLGILLALDLVTDLCHTLESSRHILTDNRCSQPSNDGIILGL
jgi:hypothetical protein